MGGLPVFKVGFANNMTDCVVIIILKFKAINNKPKRLITLLKSVLRCGNNYKKYYLLESFRGKVRFRLYENKHSRMKKAIIVYLYISMTVAGAFGNYF